MPQRNLIIGTAGHIDHGKTVLVKSLTGRDTDRLAEEKERGISIDLGFAPFKMADGSVAGIVDVPGHENFVRNMMAGATGVDLALLVVAADDGVMPQTREHLAILDFLGVSRAVVAVTKTDIVDEELIPLVVDEVAELLEGTRLEGSPIIPVSAVTGSGIDELKRELELAASEVRLKDDALPARLPIDRVFTLKGIGTVVTGTLWSGTIENGQRLALLPSGREVRIRSLQVHDAERAAAHAGERVAANLAGVSKADVARGDVLSEPGYLRPTYMVDARVAVLEDWTRPVKRGARVRFHHGTREILGRVYPLEVEAIAPGEEQRAQLRLESLAVCAPGDRFVMRSYSPVTTIGGGTVVDAHPRKHKVRDRDALEQFKELESSDVTRATSIYLARADRPVAATDIVLDSGLPPARVEKSLEELAGGGRAVILGEKGSAAYLSSDRYEETTKAIAKLLEGFHLEKPLSEGMDKETMKKKVLASWDGRSAENLLDRLERKGVIESSGKTVRLPGASASVTSEQEELIDELVERIGDNPNSPPTLSELASGLGMDRGALSELLALAEKGQRVIRVSPELYFSPEALHDIEQKLRKSLSGGGTAVGEFRNLIGTSRKYALPLLEYFDRKRVTVRVGDLRKLR